MTTNWPDNNLAADERTKQAVRQSNDPDTAALADTRALIKNPALDTGSRPAMPEQTYKPPAQHLAAPYFNAAFGCTVHITRSGAAGTCRGGHVVGRSLDDAKRTRAGTSRVEPTGSDNRRRMSSSGQLQARPSAGATISS